MSSLPLGSPEQRLEQLRADMSRRRSAAVSLRASLGATDGAPAATGGGLLSGESFVVVGRLGVVNAGGGGALVCK